MDEDRADHVVRTATHSATPGAGAPGTDVPREADVRALAARIVRDRAGEMNGCREVAEAEGLDVDAERAVVPPDVGP